MVATPEHVPNDATVSLSVNGERKQHSLIDNLIFSFGELIAGITDLITLEECDVIATGTPAGVSPLTDADTVEVTVEGTGTLEHDVTAGKFSGDTDHDFMPDQ